jgi:hypothetical protein
MANLSGVARGWSSTGGANVSWGTTGRIIEERLEKGP